MSTDQIVSAQPGFVLKIIGYLTSNPIWVITFFVDYATDYTYGQLMLSIDLDETLGTKKDFAKLVIRSDKNVKRYHAENGRYAENGFMASLSNRNQTICFCGVGDHHQNDIVERRFWNLPKYPG